MIKRCFGFEKSDLNTNIGYFHLLCSPYCSEQTQKRVISELHQRLRPSICHLSKWALENSTVYKDTAFLELLCNKKLSNKGFLSLISNKHGFLDQGLPKILIEYLRNSDNNLPSMHLALLESIHYG